MTGRGAERILTLIEWLAIRHDPASLSEIAQDLELPKSSALLLLRTLVDGRYVERGSDGGYRLIRLPGEASPENAWSAILRIAEPIIREASDAVQETGCVAVLTRDQRVRYLNKALPKREIRYDRDIAMLRTPHHVASGVVLLSSLTARQFEAYLAPLQGAEPGGHDDPDLVRVAVGKARADGFFVNLKGLVEGAAGVAAPIHDADGRLVAAMNLSGPRERIVANLDQIASTLVTAANRASEELARRASTKNRASGRKKIR